MTGKKSINTFLFAAAIFAAAAALNFFSGPVPLSRDIIALRLIRLSMAVTAGAGLAVCGTVFQALLRNPLAEPYILGVSSGAGFGAIACAVFFGGAVFLPIPAFIGALITIFAVYYLSRSGGRTPIHSLLLTGIVINVIFSSFILFLISTATTSVLHDATWWLLGNLQIFDTRLLAFISVLTVCGGLVSFFYSRELNAISLGEEEAIHLGIKTEQVKSILFLVTSIVTAALVSACGLIGFVGLIVPHISRALSGPDHRKLIPTAAAFGATFMLISDAISRTIMLPAELPVGVITAFLGGPFFLILLKRSQRLKSK